MDLSLKQNENEYYNDSIFDDLPNIEEEEEPVDNTTNTDDSDEEEDEEDKNIMKEWEDYMHDFVPADMLTYEIDKDQKEVNGKKILKKLKIYIK